MSVRKMCGCRPSGAISMKKVVAAKQAGASWPATGPGAFCGAGCGTGGAGSLLVSSLLIREHRCCGWHTCPPIYFDHHRGPCVSGAHYTARPTDNLLWCIWRWSNCCSSPNRRLRLLKCSLKGSCERSAQYGSPRSCCMLLFSTHFFPLLRTVSKVNTNNHNSVTIIF